eukprot:13368527-Heterocapsa_arctica.AAC.1
MLLANGSLASLLDLPRNAVGSSSYRTARKYASTHDVSDGRQLCCLRPRVRTLSSRPAQR